MVGSAATSTRVGIQLAGASYRWGTCRSVRAHSQRHHRGLRCLGHDSAAARTNPDNQADEPDDMCVCVCV
jgi:hypothetical protein